MVFSYRTTKLTENQPQISGVGNLAKIIDLKRLKEAKLIFWLLLEWSTIFAHVDHL